MTTEDNLSDLNNSTLELIDIGANLHHESFRHDLDNVLHNAKEQGVRTLLVTGTSLKRSEQAIALSQRYNGILYATAGIHPHDAGDFTKSSRAHLNELTKQSVVKAVGETGLDFNRNYSPHPKQQYAFEQQLELACETAMPVFMHERDAHQRFYEILKTYRDQLKAGVVHCFTSDKEALYNYLDLDLHIGITGWICDERRGKHLHKLIKAIPDNRLMLETDSPYLLPRTIKPKPKSRRNEPCYLPYVLATVATCTNQSPQQLARQTSMTARQFFDLASVVS